MFFLRRMFRTAAAVLLLIPLPRALGDETAASLSAQEILLRMASAYRDCNTYRDSGVVRTVFFEGHGQRTQDKPFSTAFVRPDSFRFSFTNTYPSGKVTTFIVWQSGPDVRRWWDVDGGLKHSASLSFALAGATGISSGSAHTVPVLLLPETVSGRSLREMSGVRRLEDARCGDATCARIEGEYGPAKQTIWIELGTFLLRRVEASTVFPKFRAETTTTYQSAINVPIPPGLLALNPPTP